MMAKITMPPAEVWDAWASDGNQVARDSVGVRALQLAHVHALAPTAVGFGALVAVCEMLSGLCPKSGRRVLEETVIAYARGAVRGLDGPVHEDGRAWEGTYHG